jgi:carbon monoxide dehydrogenase subunit G
VIDLEQSVAVDRPPETVFDYLADPAHYVEWQPAVERVELIGDARPGPGIRLRLLVRGPGPPVEAEAEITAFERPGRLGLRSLSGPAHIVADCQIEPSAAGGSLVRLRLQIELTGFLRFGEGMVRQRLGGELPAVLEDLRGRIEAQTAQSAGTAAD